MEALNFYTVDLKYIDFLKKAELKERGFSRVPNMRYGKRRKPKFVCGFVLNVNGQDYVVPVTSCKEQLPDNLLIRLAGGQVVGSLRFNYMFPVPRNLIIEKRIDKEPDKAYRALMAQELRFCVKNADTIQRLAKRTYKRVLLGKNQGLVRNSCDFRFLEEQCIAYRNRKPGLFEQIKLAVRRICALQPVKDVRVNER